MRVLLREGATNPFGASDEVARGELADAASLRRASAGVDGVYLVMPVAADRAQVVQWGRNAIDAAFAADVGMLVLNTSSIAANGPVGVPAIDAKLELKTICSSRTCPASSCERPCTWAIWLDPGRRRLSCIKAYWRIRFRPTNGYPG